MYLLSELGNLNPESESLTTFTSQNKDGNENRYIRAHNKMRLKNGSMIRKCGRG